MSADGSPRLRATLIAASLSIFVVQLDFFALNLALPKMASDLDTTTANLQWVISGYMLALAACLIPGGRLGDILGRKRMLIVGLAIFGLASLGAGVAPSAEVVIGFRIVQGLGAGILFPLAIAVVTDAFPPERTMRAIGNTYGIGAVATALGPLFGGGLTELTDWRVVLLINVPVTAAAILVVALGVRDLQQVKHYSPLDAGVIFLGASALLGIAGPLSGRLGERFDIPRTIATATMAGSVGLLLVSLGGNLGPYVVGLGLVGLGYGIGWSMASVGTQTVVPPERAGQASGVSLAIVIGSAGIAVAAAAVLIEGGTTVGSAIEGLLRWVAIGSAAAAATLAGLAAWPRRRRWWPPAGVRDGGRIDPGRPLSERPLSLGPRTCAGPRRG